MSDDKQLAADVYAAVAKLNECLSAADRAGLQITVEHRFLRLVNKRYGLPFVSVDVMRPLLSGSALQNVDGSG